MKDKIKKVTTIGLVKNINQFPSNITNDCLRVPSTSSPNINPIITGTTEKPNLLIKNPSTPKNNIIQTSSIDWLKEYVPHTETVKIIGHKILLGTKVILANIFAPKKPNIKKSMFAINIAPKIPYKKSGCSLNKSGPGLTP